MNLHSQGGWRLQPFRDGPALYSSQPPCWFHRLMQRCFFGFRWTREP